MNFDLASLSDAGYSDYLPERTETILYKDFPTVIDNTAREQFFNCPQKFFRATIQKLAPNYVSEHLHFGGAFAAGLEAMRKAFYDSGIIEKDALSLGILAATRYYGDYTPPEKSNKTYANLVDALIFYVDSRPLATDPIKPHLLSTGLHAIEFTFAEPIPGTVHPVTGDPILYAGRFDMLADFQNCVFVEDDKTTSRLGPTWNRQWKLNSQFTGYCWAAQQAGLNVAGAIIRGQSILSNSFENVEVITYRPQWMIDRWLYQLRRDVNRMIEMWQDFNRYGEGSAFDYALGSACSAYSGCDFLRLCTSSQPNDWIQSDYRNHIWNPLAKNPEEPKEDEPQI